MTIELKHIYRQSDTAFVNLLNRIRENTADDSVLTELNKRYLPGFRPKEEEGYIRLTTHNYQAQQYNDRQLVALPGQAYSFRAKTEACPKTVSWCVETEMMNLFFWKRKNGPIVNIR